MSATTLLTFEQFEQLPEADGKRELIDGEVLEMPPESPWPLAVAVCTGLLFIMLLTQHYAVAGVFAGLALLCVAGWHAKEPVET